MIAAGGTDLVLLCGLCLFVTCVLPVHTSKLVDELFIRRICKSLELGDLCFRGSIHKICTNKAAHLLKPMCCKAQLLSAKECSSIVQTLESIDSLPLSIGKLEQSKRGSSKTGMNRVDQLNTHVQPDALVYGGMLNDTALRILTINCNNVAGLCRDKDWGASRSVKQTVNLMLERNMLDGGQARNQFAASVQVEQLQKTIYRAKMRTFETQGLRNVNGRVKPLDDGLWFGELLLNLEQAQRIIDTVDHLQRGVRLPAPSPVVPNSTITNEPSRRAKRDTLDLMTDSPIRLWNDVHIKFMIEAQFDLKEKRIIESAMRDIERKSCIKFRKLKSADKNKPYIQLRKFSNPNRCMLSNLGAQTPFNVIWLNTQTCQDFKPYVLRGLLYSLGLIPEHARLDRDYWIHVDLSNVNAQYWHDLDKRPFAYMASSYGQIYNYHSILHAHKNLGAIHNESNVISASYFPEILNPLLGVQRSLSLQDGQFVKSMYCQSKDCTDSYLLCGYWASRYFCLDDRYSHTMKNVCKRSCQLCSGG